MSRNSVLWLALSLAAVSPAVAAEKPASLRGSPASMVRQHQIAKENDYTFLRTPDQVRDFVEEGRLIPVEGNGDYQVAGGVAFPYARPELQTFLERLSAQYRSGCGEQLVVTSLTRPLSKQPGNAHALSVHPAGMAADFRVSRDAGCRSWLESTLLSLERQGVLDVTRERNPPHYHVAVFPGPYMEHVQRQTAEEAARVAEPGRATVRSLEPRTTAAAPKAAGKDGLERFALAVVLSITLIFLLTRGQRTGWGDPM